MKKGTIALIAVITLGLVGSQMAFARPWGGGGGGMGGHSCWSCENYWGANVDEGDEKAVQAREKFLTETVALRKELAVKEAEYRALMGRENPDEKKAGKLAGEIFDLRNQLRQKATEHGLKPGAGCRMGRGGMGMGPGTMRGMKGGMGPGSN